MGRIIRRRAGTYTGIVARRLLKLQGELRFDLTDRGEVLVQARLARPRRVFFDVILVLFHERRQHALAQHDARIGLEVGVVGIDELPARTAAYRARTGDTSAAPRLLVSRAL